MLLIIIYPNGLGQMSKKLITYCFFLMDIDKVNGFGKYKVVSNSS
ncbi:MULTISPECIES: hypothetical protein [Providencia]|uniref:Uncharacterized protein n=1 Tax=Providencia stuartii ATCC 25827 TaxID=471874 RepID=A0AA86YPT8_PROST|nr:MULTISPECIES: hypothetical protein [Providencia]EDU57246.1 hypothetical protein PROSTU_04487 [Providencia stuartii ATCC 25827]EDU61855.1 hypothetical protein PROSTU_00124 [Providencia stuartii ATCC 25827]MDK7735595.1 hypothetical protein [Providencia stuartii]